MHNIQHKYVYSKMFTQINVMYPVYNNSTTLFLINIHEIISFVLSLVYIRVGRVLD